MTRIKGKVIENLNHQTIQPRHGGKMSSSGLCHSRPLLVVKTSISSPIMLYCEYNQVHLTQNKWVHKWYHINKCLKRDSIQWRQRTTVFEHCWSLYPLSHHGNGQFRFYFSTKLFKLFSTDIIIFV